MGAAKQTDLRTSLPQPLMSHQQPAGSGQKGQLPPIPGENVCKGNLPVEDLNIMIWANFSHIIILKMIETLKLTVSDIVKQHH